MNTLIPNYIRTELVTALHLKPDSWFKVEIRDVPVRNGNPYCKVKIFEMDAIREYSMTVEAAEALKQVCQKGSYRVAGPATDKDGALWQCFRFEMIVNIVELQGGTMLAIYPNGTSITLTKHEENERVLDLWKQATWQGRM